MYSASVLVQHIYQDMNFSSPFFITYLENSLFIIYLPIHKLYTMWENRQHQLSNNSGYVNIKNPVNEPVVNRLCEYNDDLEIDKVIDFDDETISETSRKSSISSNNLKPTYTHLEVFKMAAVIAPFWFLSNCLYYYSLEWTSVSSSTIIRLRIE